MERASLALLLVLLVSTLHALPAAPCFGTGGDMSEISGDELPDVSGDAPAKWEWLAGALVCDVVSLRDAHFAEKFPKENMESFKDHKVPVPHLVVEDGCFFLNFSKKRCLQRVADGLQRYQVYLEFVEKEVAQQSRVRDIMSKASSLLHIIQEKEKTVQLEVLEPDVKAQLLSELPSSSKWSRSISVHGVLSRMSAFATDAFRAIRYINQRLRRGRP